MSDLPKYTHYKESRVEWLGEIPYHWETNRLKFLLVDKLKYGANESAESEDRSQPRYIRITDIDEIGNLRDETFKSLEFEKAKSYLLENLDILLARSGATVGKSYLYYKKIVGDACYAGYLIRVRLDIQKFNAEFVNYFLQSKIYWDWVKAVNIQATIQNISAEKYSDLILSIPPLKEQKTIAKYLDKKLAQINTLITKQQELLEKLAEQRIALISNAVTKGINHDVEMKDSDVEWLGKIPDTWKIIAFHYISRLKSGEAITSLNFNSEGIYPVYGGNGFRGYIDKYNHDGNYILIGRQGALCGNINTVSGKFFASEHAIVVNPTKEFNLNWLYYLLNTMNLNQYSTSAAQPGLSAEVIGRLKIPFPSMSEQILISDYLDLVITKIKKIESSHIVCIEKLKEYRLALITQAVTGKIDVRNLNQ